MKKGILLILIIISIFSCKDKKNDIPKENIKTEITKPIQEIKYVTAKSGLIYRDNPKGKKLGKFEFNEAVIISKHTNIFQDIKNGNETIKGEWLSSYINKKEVFFFSGFLSNSKSKITLDDVKNFMGNYVWISQDFKNILEKTKSYKKSFYYGFSLDLKYKKPDMLEGNLLKAQDDVLYSIKSLLTSETTKIIDINNTTLTIRNKNKNHVFIKNKNNNADDIFEDWFKGDYLFKDENTQKKYTSKEIVYTSELGIDFMYINNYTYKIDKIKENIYYLSQIKFTEGEKEDEKWEMGGDFEYDIVYITPTGKKATLTKEQN